MKTFDKVKRALKNNPSQSYKEIAKRLKVKASVVQTYGWQIRKSNPNLRKLTKTYVLEEYLRKNPEASSKDLMETCKVNYDAISTARAKLGIESPRSSRKTHERRAAIEKELQENPNIPNKELSKKHGVSMGSISLIRKKARLQLRTRVSAQEIQTLRLFSHLPTKTLAKILKRRERTLVKVLRELGLNHRTLNIKKRRQKVYKYHQEGHDIRDIAFLLETDPGTVRRDLDVLKKRGYPIKEKETTPSKILNTYHPKLTISQVARTVGCSHQLASTVLRKAGLLQTRSIWREKIPETERQTIETLIKQGESVKSISQKTKRSPRAIYQIKKKCLPAREEQTIKLVRLALKNTPVQEIAQEMGESVPVTIQRIKTALPFRDRPIVTYR